MYSQILSQNGLIHCIGGIAYNFKFSQGQSQVETSLISLASKLENRNQGIYYADQIHQNQVSYVNQSGRENQIFLIQGSDGLITDVPGLAIAIKFADCTPIVIYDPVQKVQASVHSGWRSTLQQISRVAIEKMLQEFSCQLDDLVVYLGPTIDQANYEVGEEVYRAFEGFPDRDHIFIPGKANGKYQLSMQAANLAILKDIGLLDQQIEVCDVSTYTSPSLHSARRDGPDYGLNAIITMIPIEEPKGE